MKKINLVKIITVLIIFLCGSFVNHAFAQNTEKSDKEIKIKIVKEVDGKTTVIDTIINSDADFDSEDLKYFIKVTEEKDEIDSLLRNITIDLNIDGDSITKRINKKVFAITKKLDSVDFDIDFDFDFDFESLKDIEDLKHLEVFDSIKTILIKADLDENILDELKAIDIESKIKVIESDDGEIIIYTDEDGGENSKDIFIDVISDDDGGITIKSKDGKSILKDKKVFVFSDDDNHKFVRSHRFYKIKIRDINSPEKLKALGISTKKNKLEIGNVNLILKSKNKVQLKFDLQREGKTTIELMNINGKEIFKEKVKYFPGTYDKTIDVSGFDNHKFILHIVQGNSSITKKIVLQ